MKTSEQFYGVQIIGAKSGLPRLAIGAAPQAGAWLSYWRQPAIEFKKGLVREGFTEAKVVKVMVTYDWESVPAPGRLALSPERGKLVDRTLALTLALSPEERVGVAKSRRGGRL